MDMNGYAPFSAAFDHVPRTTGGIVPKCKHKIRILNDGSIAAQRSISAVFVIFRKKLGQLNPVGKSIGPCAGVYAPCPSAYDFRYSLRQIFFQVIYPYTSGAYYRYLQTIHPPKKYASLLRRIFAISAQDYNATI